MLKAFVTLFANADVWFYVLYVACFICLLLRYFIKTHGILAFAGILLFFGAITERCTKPNLTATEIIFYMIYMTLILALVLGLIRLIVKLCLDSKKAKVTAKVKGNNVPLTSEGNPDYSFLVGRTGEVVADLRPTGKVNVDGRVYEVTTEKEYIYSGTKVVVSRVLAQKIVVKKLREEKNA